MRQTQPNFEKLKVILFNFICNSPEFNFALLGGQFQAFHKKKIKAREELNTILNNMDIRTIVEVMNKLPKNFLPIWFRNKKYVIDYNKHGMLDFIK
jgi:hypothetical protein